MHHLHDGEEVKTGRIKLLCSSCGQVYRILATDEDGERDATVYGECEGCTIEHGEDRIANIETEEGE